MVLSSDVTRVLGGCRLLLQPLHVLTAPSTLTFGKQFTIYGQLWHFREERGRLPEVAWSSRFAKTKPDKHIDIGVTWFSGWTRQSGSRGPPNRHRTPRLLLPSHCWSPWMFSGSPANSQSLEDLSICYAMIYIWDWTDSTRLFLCSPFPSFPYIF